MLTSTPGELRIELLEHEADETSGSARWRAHYTFSETGRPVINDIHATFRFEDGLIVEHRDEFDFHRWARQALPPGVAARLDTAAALGGPPQGRRQARGVHWRVGGIEAVDHGSR